MREVRVDPAHGVRRAGGAAKPQSVRIAAAASVGHAGDHLLGDELGELPAWMAGEQDEMLAPSPESLAQHAAELAERLQQRLADVDRRESRLNSQEAEFDTRIRNARLWIDQRESELTDLEQKLSAWEGELVRRQEEAAAQLERAEEVARRLAELAERERVVAAKEIDLEIALTEQQTKLDSLDFEAAACRTRQQDLDQARQKCEHRQRELDQREAKIYVEQERASQERLALDSKQTELASRETRLIAEEAKLADYERRLADQAGEIEFQRAELQQQRHSQEQRATSLAADEKRLEYRQREIATALERFERLGIVEQKMSEAEDLASTLAMRANYLDSAEAMLAERHLQFDVAQRELEHDRLAFENGVARQRRAQAAQAQEAETKIADRRQLLDVREAELDQREQALERIAEQLRHTQRDALEMRLAIEETWLQLQGALAPAALTRSITQLRSRLADTFRLESDEVRRQRGELETVRQALAEQLAGLHDQRQELQRWADSREQEIEERAARLMTREAELDAHQRHYETEQRRWESQRLEYQQEIQRLLAELRSGLKTAA
jgi:chromosome segregation ATPase